MTKARDLKIGDKILDGGKVWTVTGVIRPEDGEPMVTFKDNGTEGFMNPNTKVEVVK